MPPATPHPAILSVGRALPPNWVDQETLIQALSAYWGTRHFNVERLADVHRAAKVGGRHLALPLAEYPSLDSFKKTNDAFIRVATDVGEEAIRAGLAAAGLAPGDVDHLWFVTVTGISTPSLDAKLAKLSYRAPALVAEMLADANVGASRTLDVLDAGCGTGLCGPLVAPYARRLVGVDLSERMIDQARARNVYDELVRGELSAYLRDFTGAFDVIVSADTLVYFGPLEEVVAAAENALRAGGRLVFTVEELRGAGREAEWSISPNGRYRHGRAYVERVLAAASLRSEIVPAELRLEAGESVAGLVVRAAKGGSRLGC